MNLQSNSYEDSISFDYNRPISVLERLDYVRQLIFSKTKVEFKLIWNKIFQKEDEELGWLLNPYRQDGTRPEATMMSQLDRNFDKSYQYGYDDVRSALGSERVTVHSRGLVKKEPKKKHTEKEKTMGEKALQIARYMGMGVYITSTAFPSPYLAATDQAICEDTFYSDRRQVYGFGKLW